MEPSIHTNTYKYIIRNPELFIATDYSSDTQQQQHKNKVKFSFFFKQESLKKSIYNK